MRTRSSLPGSCLLPILLLVAPPARALDVVVQSVAIESLAEGPRIVRLDVWLDLAPGEAAPDLAAFQAAVTLSGPSGDAVLVPPATLPSPAHPAIIGSNFTPDFAGGDGPARASAAAFLDAGSATVSDGEGLMRVDVQIAAGSAGVFTLSVDTEPFQGTVLADPLGGALPFTAIDGVLDVALPSGPSVPGLPAVARLALLGLLGAVLLALPRAQVA